MHNLTPKNLAATLSPVLLAKIPMQVATALQEDLSNTDCGDQNSRNKDLTAHLINALTPASASIISREPAIICGIDWVNEVFKQVDARSEIEWHVAEGSLVVPNQTLCFVSGYARSLLTAERVALNFLQTLSATATTTKNYVDAIAGTQARILDTRKTIPNMRLAQKYAVTVGGGLNQRIGLYDGILIKENHIMACGSIGAALNAAFKIQAEQPDVTVQIEVENLNQLTEALSAGAKSVLLDNFAPALLLEAVKLNSKRALLEASGGITLENVREIAETGVDRISIGGITKHVQAIDLSMRFATH